VNPKQQKFADYYIKTGNATESAIHAGYSKKTAFTIGNENLNKPYIKEYIAKELDKLHKETIASAEQVLEFLTKGVNQELEEEVVVTEMVAGTSEARIIKKKISCKDAVKCAELLGKRYRLFADKIDITVDKPIIKIGKFEEDDEDDC